MSTGLCLTCGHVMDPWLRDHGYDRHIVCEGKPTTLDTSRRARNEALGLDDTPTDAWTLGMVREWLRGRVDDGEKCPCCTQMAKVYRRKIHSSMARALIVLYRAVGTAEFGHLPTITGTNEGDTAKMRYWGLIVPQPDVERADGSNRVGYWKVTPLGEQFVLGTAAVPEYARIYDGRCLGLDGDPFTIHDALGTAFNYTDLMAGV